MDAQTRRNAIAQAIQASEKPISARALAKQFHVSRQIVVGDVALLRASGKAIIATPRGYLDQSNDQNSQGLFYTIAVQHDRSALAEEIYTIVDLGGELLDVIVEHPYYGELIGQLHISSRYDADQFFALMDKEEAIPLCNLTNGLHLHTLRVPNAEIYERILQALQCKGFLYKK